MAIEVVKSAGLATLVAAAVQANTSSLRDTIVTHAKGDPGPQGLPGEPGAPGLQGDPGPHGPSGASVPRSQVTAASSHQEVLPYLPATKTPARGTIKTVNRVRMNTSAQYPDPISWSEDTMLKIIVQNPAESGQNANFGYGIYNNPNNQGMPDVVPPGKEWVGFATPLPIFGRMDTTSQPSLVISERSA